MYSEKELKLYSIEVIKESNLSNKDKLFLLKELQKSDYHRTMEFLNKGQMYFGDLNESKKQLIEEEFLKNEDLNESIYRQLYLTEGWGKTILGMILLTPVGWVIWRLMKATFSSAQRKCGVLSIGKARDLCLLRAKLQKLELKKKAILRNDCKNASNPTKCQNAVQEELDKIDSKIDFMKGRIQDLSGIQVP